MGKFVYVFSEAAKEQLLKQGHTLIQYDEESGRYVFSLEGEKECFSLDGIKGVTSNILTF